MYTGERTMSGESDGYERGEEEERKAEKNGRTATKKI